ncbi:MAG: serine/threonine protein kinase [Deltaproteobacteria bacterium]|nr:serine/threonine protein kinase [Deltaproteobacteria bacterium]
MSSGGNDEFRLIGRVIDEKFRVERVLGEGGYGVVYAGTHLVLGLPVAIKCLKPFGSTLEERTHSADAFLREARILFTLGHPSIVRLYDVGIIPDGHIPYCVLELLGGRTLAEELGRRRRTRQHFDAAELVSILTPILEAVGFAHSHGVVHRDLKPGNIMLVEEPGGRLVPKVLDFGTARDAATTGRAGAAADLTGKTGFTPLYAAPEQWDNKFGRTGPHTDVFALGLTMVELCVLDYALGTPANVMGLYLAALDETKRPSVRAARPDLPPELDLVIQRALRANVGERYPDARELLASFRAAMKADPSTAGMARPLALSSGVSSPPQTPPVYGSPAYASAPMGAAAPMGAYAASAMPYASTTQPQAITMHGPPVAAPPARSSALPWVLGIAGVVLALLGAVAVGLVFAIHKLSETAAGEQSPAAAPATQAPPAAPGGPVAPAATSTVATGPGAPAAKPGAAPAVAPGGVTPPGGAPQPGTAPSAAPAAPAPATNGKVPGLVLQNALDPTPMWTKAEVLDVANSHQGGMNACVRNAFATDPKVSGFIDIIISPTETGSVGNAMCSMRNHRNTNGESVMCSCMQGEMVRWKFPAPHGRIGALKTKSFIYEYRLLTP